MIKSSGRVFLANSGERTLSAVATRAIAAVAAKLLLHGSWSGQDSVPVVGPDDLSPKAMAQIMSEVLERSVRFPQVSGEVDKATLLHRRWPLKLTTPTLDLERQNTIWC